MSNVFDLTFLPPLFLKGFSISSPATSLLFQADAGSFLTDHCVSSREDRR